MLRKGGVSFSSTASAAHGLLNRRPSSAEVGIQEIVGRVDLFGTPQTTFAAPSAFAQSCNGIDLVGVVATAGAASTVAVKPAIHRTPPSSPSSAYAYLRRHCGGRPVMGRLAEGDLKGPIQLAPSPPHPL